MFSFNTKWMSQTELSRDSKLSTEETLCLQICFYSEDGKLVFVD